MHLNNNAKKLSGTLITYTTFTWYLKEYHSIFPKLKRKYNALYDVKNQYYGTYKNVVRFQNQPLF